MEELVREALPEDFDGVFELVLELREHFGEKKALEKDKLYPIYLRFLDSDDNHIYVAEDDERLAGFISMTIGVSLYGEKPYMVIDELIVTAGYRGQGIGKSLISQAIDRAKEFGCSEICVDTTVANEGAIRFYRKHGFTHENILFEMELDKGDG